MILEIYMIKYCVLIFAAAFNIPSYAPTQTNHSIEATPFLGNGIENSTKTPIITTTSLTSGSGAAASNSTAHNATKPNSTIANEINSNDHSSDNSSIKSGYSNLFSAQSSFETINPDYVIHYDGRVYQNNVRLPDAKIFKNYDGWGIFVIKLYNQDTSDQTRAYYMGIANKLAYTYHRNANKTEAQADSDLALFGTVKFEGEYASIIKLVLDHDEIKKFLKISMQMPPEETFISKSSFEKIDAFCKTINEKYNFENGIWKEDDSMYTECKDLSNAVDSNNLQPIMTIDGISSTT